MIENKQGSVWITVARHRACLGSLHRKTATPGRPRTLVNQAPIISPFPLSPPPPTAQSYACFGVGLSLSAKESFITSYSNVFHLVDGQIKSVQFQPL